ncbi:MAG TPA: YbjQ family protein [Candidatus Marinimicrobia bacterium]|nr:YbjQ family protein [Candidatus Neomarinimicrobiota bacterium]
MIVSTQDQLAGYQVVETLGLVQGSTIRARHIGTDILAGLRNIVGGEVHEYTKMLAESRDQSLDRMIANAEEAGANAVLCMRFSTSTVMSGMAEFLAYGTAVKIEPVS